MNPRISRLLSGMAGRGHTVNAANARTLKEAKRLLRELNLRHVERRRESKKE